MTSHDQEQGDALAPGMQDQWRRDDTAPRADQGDVDTGASGPQGGQLA